MRYQELTECEILDTQTGLVWRRNPEPGAYTFEEAFARASQVAEETGQAWRVPTVEELASLVDRSRKEPASNFPDMSGIRFRSSSPYVGNTNLAWFVNFSYGFVDFSFRSSSNAVRLVRGG